MATDYSAPGAEANEAFVMVPVPSERVLEVYALLGSPQPERHSASSVEERWSASDVRRLLAIVRSPVTQAMLQHLALTPGEWRPLREIVSELQITEPELRAALSGFTRTIKAHLNRSDWPIKVRSERGVAGSQTAYCMPRDVAKHVTDVELSPSSHTRQDTSR